MTQFKTETAVGLFVSLALIIFIYMTFKVGFFRLHKSNYVPYHVLFADVAGLKVKDDVKIAGVKVGWVDLIELLPEKQRVKASIMVLKDCVLYEDANAVVRQEALLGNKFLELVPGTPGAKITPQGGVLAIQGMESVSVDNVLGQVKTIAHHVETIMGSFNQTFCSEGSMQTMQQVLAQLSQAVTNLATMTKTLDSMIARNGTAVDTVINDMALVVDELKTQLPIITSEVKDLATKLSQQVVPMVKDSVERVSNTLDTNLARMSNQVEAVTGSLGDITTKINNGEGFIGEMLNDDKSYKELRSAVSTLKGALDKVTNIAIQVDAHSESMLNCFGCADFKDSKGYCDFRIWPAEDYFYWLGLVSRQSGRVLRDEVFRQWLDECGNPIDADNLTDRDKLRFAPIVQEEVRQFDWWLWNLQFGKVFGNWAFRFGLFESTAGVALDVNFPIYSNWCKLISSFEAYDFRGRLRIDDDRPHLKWINRLYLTRNLYFTFGYDDFVSVNNKSPFLGGGICFDDDDIKYILSGGFYLFAGNDR